MYGVPLASRAGQIRWAADARRLDDDQRDIGSISYAIDDQVVTSQLLAPPNSQSYDIQIPSQQTVPGLAIGSHRSSAAHYALPNVPIQFSTAEALLNQFVSEYRNRSQGANSARSPMSYMKEALYAAAIYGEGNSALEPNEDARAVWTGFQEVLRRVLPASLRFESLAIRPPEVLVRTTDAEFLLESMSGGVSALIELAWQVFLRSRSHAAFTVCIDEPENHLHPSLQRSLLPLLLTAFPGITFVVATHSPFVVTAVPDSHVYVLDYEDDGVVSRLLDRANKASSPDETLRRVLGLETTVPLWVETRLGTALENFDPENPSAEQLVALRDALTEAGLADEFPASVEVLIERPRDANA